MKVFYLLRRYPLMERVVEGPFTSQNDAIADMKKYIEKQADAFNSKPDGCMDTGDMAFNDNFDQAIQEMKDDQSPIVFSYVDKQNGQIVDLQVLEVETPTTSVDSALIGDLHYSFWDVIDMLEENFPDYSADEEIIELRERIDNDKDRFEKCLKALKKAGDHVK